MPREKTPFRGKYGESRSTWTRLSFDEIVIFTHPESRTGEPGEDIYLVITQQPHLKKMTLDLTSLTEAELDALEEVVKEAFDRARPIVRDRDQHAKHEWENNDDDSFVRLYRPVPQVHRRQRRQ